MSTPFSAVPSRRQFLSRAGQFGAAGFAGAMLAGCNPNEPSGAESGGAGSDRKRLRAAFSNAGLQSTWCQLGKETAELWGRLLDVDVVWFDGEFDPQKQRDKIDLLTTEDWDFCCFQAIQIDSLVEPVRKLKERGIPVISMDTLLVETAQMRDVGVWSQVQPDQVFMGESSARYMFEKIGGKGKVIHIGGLSAHSGARGRNEGFENVRLLYPNVDVLGGGVRWCDWEKQKARDVFDALLNQETEPVAGAFFHSDDMALACVDAIKNTIHEKMVITAVDGQKEGLAAVKSGLLAATTVNPVCLIHMTSLAIGQFIVRNQEKVEELPRQIVTPGPLVAQETGDLEAMLYLADPRHCLV